MEFPLAPLDRLNRIVTILVVILILAILGAALLVVTPPESYFLGGFGLFLILIFLIAAGLSPRAVRIAPEGVVIVRRCWPSLLFPWNEFTAIRVERGRWVNRFYQLVKIFGTAGFLGYFGWFRLKGVGMVRCYATRLDGGIILSGKRTVIITPADLDGASRMITTFLPKRPQS